MVYGGCMKAPGSGEWWGGERAGLEPGRRELGEGLKWQQ